MLILSNQIILNILILRNKKTISSALSRRVATGPKNSRRLFFCRPPHHKFHRKYRTVWGRFSFCGCDHVFYRILTNCLYRLANGREARNTQISQIDIVITDNFQAVRDANIRVGAIL